MCGQPILLCLCGNLHLAVNTWVISSLKATFGVTKSWCNWHISTQYWESKANDKIELHELHHVVTKYHNWSSQPQTVTSCFLVFFLSTGDLQSFSYLVLASPRNVFDPISISLLHSLSLREWMQLWYCFRRLSATQNFSRNMKITTSWIKETSMQIFCISFFLILAVFLSLLINYSWGRYLKGPERSIGWKRSRVTSYVWSSRRMFATNLLRAVERAGKQWTWKENKYTQWIFFPLTIQKYNSTIVNLGMYISLGNRENCNKCISAFVYTFCSKELHKPS